MSKFNYEVISYLDRDDLVAEIYYESDCFAEIVAKEEGVIIKFYSHSSEQFWEFPCEETLKILEEAKIKLLMTKNRGTFLHRLAPIDPDQVNEQAEKILEAIVTHPERKMIQGKLERFGDVVDIYAPNMGGARYSSDGDFLGFLE